MNGARLRLEAIRVHRAGRDLLDIDLLEVPPGEVLAVIGRNGAGKTTLLSVCCGLLRPTAGRVLINALTLRGPCAPRRRQVIGYLPQTADYNADLPLTVEEIVRLGRAARRGLLRRFTGADRDIAAWWIERLGLTELRRRTFRTLSGGEQQKALLARAMAQEPALLLLDEPGAHLDLDWRRRLTDTIESIYVETGVTILMVSHDVALIPPCCTRVALMDAGRVIQSGAPAHVLTQTNLSRLYRCPVKVWERNGVRHAAARGGAPS